ncbi:MAG: hypothetical protein HQL69_18550 [Magnetococcales bacterium]|nr:hypothetical protein [Magnetococcales bacterium]
MTGAIQVAEQIINRIAPEKDRSMLMEFFNWRTVKKGKSVVDALTEIVIWVKDKGDKPSQALIDEATKQVADELAKWGGESIPV